MGVKVTVYHLVTWFALFLTVPMIRMKNPRQGRSAHPLFFRLEAPDFVCTVSCHLSLSSFLWDLMAYDVLILLYYI